MKTYLYILLVAIGLSSCNVSSSNQLGSNKLNLPSEGFEFELVQRKKIEIPSDSNNVFCSIDDITLGQTQLKIKSNKKLLLNKSISEGEEIEFDFNANTYLIECTSMTNKLVGDDYANFRISKGKKSGDNQMDESEKIENLLSRIEQSDVIFIRNGSEHTPKEAAEHLRSKWLESDVKTLESFIENIASKSSMSGKPYLVKLKSGETIEAKEWYKILLK